MIFKKGKDEIGSKIEAPKAEVRSIEPKSDLLSVVTEKAGLAPAPKVVEDFNLELRKIWKVTKAENIDLTDSWRWGKNVSDIISYAKILTDYEEASYQIFKECFEVSHRKFDVMERKDIAYLRTPSFTKKDLELAQGGQKYILLRWSLLSEFGKYIPKMEKACKEVEIYIGQRRDFISKEKGKGTAGENFVLSEEKHVRTVEVKVYTLQHCFVGSGKIVDRINASAEALAKMKFYPLGIGTEEKPGFLRFVAQPCNSPASLYKGVINVLEGDDVTMRREMMGGNSFREAVPNFPIYDPSAPGDPPFLEKG